MTVAAAKDVQPQDWQPERLFWRHVTVGAPTDCWNWTGFIEKDGYGYAMRRGLLFYVHRVSYVLAGHSIEPGQVIDHLCRNRACVNPAHLEAPRRPDGRKRMTTSPIHWTRDETRRELIALGTSVAWDERGAADTARSLVPLIAADCCKNALRVFFDRLVAAIRDGRTDDAKRALEELLGGAA